MEREALIEAIAALGAAAVFIVAILLVGIRYGNGALSPQGGRALVGVLAGFVLLLTVAGYLLSAYST